MASEPPELGLVEGPAAGFEDLYRAQFVAMVRVAHLLTGSNVVAEDVVQDAFIALRGGWHGIRDPSPYLRAAVVNGCRSWHRHRRSEAARLRAAPVPGTVSLGAYELLDALAGLPWGQRTALVLRYYADLSEADVAAAMGCRPGTVKSHLHRGIDALRKVIG
jgi:RNA polymerase sigma-70 factor (sigma-E family)